jgi:hypothetical protein
MRELCVEKPGGSLITRPEKLGASLTLTGANAGPMTTARRRHPTPPRGQCVDRAHDAAAQVLMTARPVPRRHWRSHDLRHHRAHASTSTIRRTGRLLMLSMSVSSSAFPARPADWCQHARVVALRASGEFVPLLSSNSNYRLAAWRPGGVRTGGASCLAKRGLRRTTPGPDRAKPRQGAGTRSADNPGARQGSPRHGPHPDPRPCRAASGCGWHTLPGWRAREARH